MRAQFTVAEMAWISVAVETIGITTSTIVPGDAFRSRKSPPSSLTRCLMPPMPTPMLPGRKSAISSGTPTPSSRTEARSHSLSSRA